MFKIIGTSSYLPEKIMTNFDLEKIVDTTDAWIRDRTGISERRIADKDETNSDLAVNAAKKALEAAGLAPQDVEILVVGTSTPDYTLPAVAPIIQHKLGCGNIPAFDINSVCSSFAYALITAAGFLCSGFYKNCLIIGSDVYSRILNWKDRTTCCIFGDGAGAVVLSRDASKRGILSYNYGVKGEDAELIKIHVGGSNNPVHYEKNYNREDYFFQMNGLDVYEFTIMTVPAVVEDLVQKAGIQKEEVDWVILHQANIRIIESVAKKTEISVNRFIINIQKVGNTSSASIPLALDEAVRVGKIKDGDKVIMVGFGGGLSWGGVLIEW
ncbi:MAG TPA: beta-ketoacyl-ACP synthase III [Spirochaetota bacterium]|nr:beta-ketoacyl-ACP synthase III [Spirochaetota bacterium]